MAAATLVFKEHMMKESQLATAQEQEHQQAAAEKSAGLVGMANKIEADTTTAIHEVAARTAVMTPTAEEMSASAARTGRSAEEAASASAQALANVQTVASAAEQLNASIREIGGQVALSNKVVGRAVAGIRCTRHRRWWFGASDVSAHRRSSGDVDAAATPPGRSARRLNRRAGLVYSVWRIASRFISGVISARQSALRGSTASWARSV